MRESPMNRITRITTTHGHTRRHGWPFRVALVVALLTMAPLASAQEDYDAGKRAYLAGDYAEAVRIWQPLADEGNKYAQFSLGSLYFEGSGVEKSMESSAKWFRLSADQGYAPAQFNLGNAYKHGNGVEQDDLKAADWWRKAAEQEFADAQFNLATQYYFGRGVEKNEETAIRWYRRAAENGHPQAQRLFSMTDSPASQARADTSQAGAATAPASTESASPTATAAAAATVAASSSAPPSPPAPVAETAAGGASNESWLLAQNPDAYTLQLLATNNKEQLRAFLDKHTFSEPIAYFAFQRDGKQWYAAVHGAYPEKAQAQNAVAALPPDVGKNPPWIRQFGGIQKLIKAP